ncbi:hypothetical protein GCM10023336_61320 [Streptomyces similanensis]|uniref:Uncharacterized protein n=1 Tax=Streptomyces similanensis TaxID=1274988 RepID=A0ABP9LAA1_9ACTN
MCGLGQALRVVRSEGFQPRRAAGENDGCGHGAIGLSANGGCCHPWPAVRRGAVVQHAPGAPVEGKRPGEERETVG